MELGKPCIVKVALPPKMREYIISQRERHLKDGLNEKEADILTAKELQHKAENELNNLYNRLDIDGYANQIKEPIIKKDSNATGKTQAENKKLAEGNTGESNTSVSNGGGNKQGNSEREVGKEGQGGEGGKEPPIKQQPEKLFPEEEGTGISNSETEKLREKYKLGDYERNNRSDAELELAANEAIREGYPIEKLVKQIESGVPPTAVENFIINKHLSELNKIANKSQSEKDIESVNRVIKALDKIGSIQSESFRTRRYKVRTEDSLAGFWIEEQDTNMNAPLEGFQKEQVRKEWNDISEKDKDYNDRISKLEEENAKLKAEKELKKEASKNKTKSKRTAEDFKQERDSLKEKLAKQFEEYKNSYKKLGIVSDGGAESAIISIKMAKTISQIVKSHVEQFGDNLKEVTKRVYEEIKDIFPVTEKDIHDIIAGEYSPARPTKNELAEKMQDIKLEAQLITKYQKLISGEEPKSNKEKVKRNIEIETLRKRINDLRREQAIAAKPTKEEIPTEVLKLKAITEKNNKELERIELQLKSGEFSTPEKAIPLLENEELKKKFPEQFKEALASKDALIAAKNERKYRLLQDKYANQTKYEKSVRIFANTLNIPRALMSTLDFSAVLRQGLIPAIANPKMAKDAMAQMFKSSVSQKEYNRWLYDLQQSGRYDLMKETDLAITDSVNADLKAREELFMSNLVDQVPVVGALSRGSERAYSQFLNKMRVDLFNRFADSMEERGLTFKNSPNEYKQMAAYINNSTGRGDLRKTLNNAAPILNTLFFSPRLISSRINMLTYFAQPRFYKTVPKEVRIDYFKSMAKFIGLGLTVLALAKLNGADVETDQRSSDFGKIKVGNTRWDIWGGFSQYIRVRAQFLSGQSVSINTGKVRELDGEGIFGTDRSDPLTSMLRGKLAPVPSIIVDLAKKRNIVGEHIQPFSYWNSSINRKDHKAIIGAKEYLANHFLPLISTGLIDAVKDQGIKAWFTVGVPSIFGVGTQTFSTSNHKNK